ncbi:thiamine pyrophosphate-binding protein [Nocardioides humi]|uniref:Thiamine pyrophosphate-binding protein n=1 Tax=Nocardioides humi TaxID=449461 RepID=A0ABN2B2V4_9ACTN|nr:thiamine pyrophosphate-binding protein [Nocardioides humi]
MPLVHETVATALLDSGMTTMFGVLGDANMVYVHDFTEGGGNYLAAAEERAAVMMAIGAAQLTGSVGVATVTHGPGLTNAFTSLVEAVRGRVPLLLLTGETPPVHDYVQAIDIPTVVNATGATYRRVLDPAHTYHDVCQALREARAARLPVVLDVPYRLLWEESARSGRPAVPRPRQAVSPGEDAMDAALGIIASASRPVVLAGRGATAPAARDALLRLSERLGAPVATSLMGRDLFKGEPWDLGVLGTVSHDIAIDTVGSSDCVIAFGASLNKYTSSHGWLYDGRAVIQVDNDPERIGRHAGATTGVVGDAESVALAMVEALDSIGHSPSGFRSQALADRLAARDPRADFKDTSGAEYVDARTAMIRLDEVLPPDRLVVSDVGRFVIAPWKYLHVSHPGDFAHTANFGSIGLGLAAAAGASAVRTDRITVAVVGDGGLMMSLAEIATVVRHSLPLVVVVVNDTCYGAEWAQLEKFGIDPRMSLFDWPSFAEVARSMGAHAVTARTENELDVVAEHISRGELPLVVDLRIDPAVEIGDVR